MITVDTREYGDKEQVWYNYFDSIIIVWINAINYKNVLKGYDCCNEYMNDEKY